MGRPSFFPVHIHQPILGRTHQNLLPYSALGFKETPSPGLLSLSPPSPLRIPKSLPFHCSFLRVHKHPRVLTKASLDPAVPLTPPLYYHASWKHMGAHTHSGHLLTTVLPTNPSTTVPTESLIPRNSPSPARSPTSGGSSADLPQVSFLSAAPRCLLDMACLPGVLSYWGF